MKILLIIWISILILTGSYFRTRNLQEIETYGIDWFIIVQLFVCALGGIVCTNSILKYYKWGLGTKALLVFVTIAALSAFFTPFPTKVIGYWILLAGVSLLTINLVQKANTQKELTQIENAWFITITLIIIKDTIISLLFPELQSEWDYGRLGMGVTHANKISFLAALAFWLSFTKEQRKFPVLIWLSRILFLLVILLARSRIALICLIIGGIVRLWFSNLNKDLRGLAFRTIIPYLFLHVVLLFFLLLKTEAPLIVAIFNIINRGQDRIDIASLTGRTKIWHSAIIESLKDPVTFIFGHGYGMSDNILNDSTWSFDFYIYHAHNDFLEILLNMGLIGLIIFIVLVAYSISWMTKFTQMQKKYSPDFVLRAISVIVMILVYSITEVNFGNKIGPVVVIYMFYILALDRRNNIKPI